MSDKRRRGQERVLEEIVLCEEGKRGGEEQRKDAVEHPPSPYSTLPSVPSFVPSHMEEEVGVTSLPEYQVGDTALLEANTKGRGCNLFYISSFCIHSQMYATLLVRFS